MATKKPAIIFFGIIILFVIIWSNTQFSYWPEMLLWPYLITKHWLPYQDIAIAHSPALPIIVSAVYSLFGASPIVLKIFSWLVVILTSILVFIVAKAKTNSKLALISATVYLLFQYRYEGNGLWFDILLAPSLLLTYFLFKKKKYFLSGVMLALSFFIKQTTFWFIIPFLLQFIFEKIHFKSFISFASGSFLVICGTIIFLFMWGIFPSYWHWAVQFGLFILPRSTPKLVSGLMPFISCTWPFYIELLLPWVRSRKVRQEVIELLVLSVFSCFGAFPRWELFHFQPGLPFLSLAIIIVVANTTWKSLFPKVILTFYVGIFSIIFCLHLRNIWRAPDRFLEPEVALAILYTKTKTQPGDTIFVLNWWDSLYALSGRVPPRPWIPQLPQYLSLPKNEDALVGSLAERSPKLVLFKKYESGSYIPTKLVQYIYSHYHPEIEVGRQYEILIPN